MPADPQSDHAIVNTRLLPWSRERIWAAYADPAQLSLWWGPAGFTNTFQQCEFRVGGAWRFTMRGPDGAGYPMEKQFIELVPLERIVLRHFQQGHGFTLTMILAPEGAGTLLTWRMLFDERAEVERVGAFVRTANEQNFDRLEAHLRSNP